MAITIKFDSAKELKDFLGGKKTLEKSGKSEKATAKKAGRPGRPAKKTTQTVKATKTLKTAKPAKGAKVLKGKVGRPKGKTAKTPLTKILTKASLVKKVKRGTGTRGELTRYIVDAIDGFVKRQKEFTANDIFDVVSKKNGTVNKQSVITSVLKQMKTAYKSIPVSERPGAGPRAVKVYIPA